MSPHPKPILCPICPVAALLRHFGLQTRGELARRLGLYDGTYLHDVQRGYARPVKLAAVVKDRFGLDLAELCHGSAAAGPTHLPLAQDEPSKSRMPDDALKTNASDSRIGRATPCRRLLGSNSLDRGLHSHPVRPPIPPRA